MEQAAHTDRPRAKLHKMGIEIGTPITWNSKPVELPNNYIAMAAADDRAGLTAIITVAKNLKDIQIPSTVYYFSFVEEVIGLRGAEAAIFDLNIDMTVAVDTCASGYQPDSNPLQIVYEIGRGPALQVAEMGLRTRISSRVVREWLLKTSKKYGFPARAV